MAPTMKEVATRAGVSPKTVSRVVNDHPSISPGVRERVRRAIEELGWVPNAQARSLRTGRTGLIAVSLADLKAPTAARIAQALVSEAERHGLRVSIEPSRGRPARVHQTLASRGALFDAVVHVGPLPAGVELPPADPERPVVLLGTGVGSPDPSTLADIVDSDEAGAATALTQHLRMVRHHDVVLLGREPGRPDAFLDHLSSAFLGTPVLRPEACEREPGRRVADRVAGRRLAALALKRHPEVRALVCADDELAVGALSLLHAHGIDVPERIALTGYGNIDDGRFSTPSLTTIDLDIPELARRAVERIAARRDGDRSEPQRTVVPVRLVRGESTLGATRAASEVATWRE